MVRAVSGTLIFNLLDDGLDVAEQNLIIAEACHTIAVLLSGKEVVGFRYAVMAVAPIDDDRFRPTAPDMLHDTPQVQHYLLAGRTSAGTKDRGDQFATQPLKDMERQVEGLLMVPAEERQLVLAVNDILGIVKVQNNDERCLGVGIEKMVEKADSHAIEFRPGNHVLKPAEGGLAGKIISVVRQVVKSHLQGGILP